MRNSIPKEDLIYIASSLEDIASSFRDARIFITGGTGFFGKWLLEAFIHLNQQYGLNCSLIVLSRNPKEFISRYPQFDKPEIEYIEGDIRSFSFPTKKIDYCIHAAAETANLATTDELEVLQASYDGTKKVLELASLHKAKATLYVSSGAIYGKQPPALRYIPETYAGAPDISKLNSSYGEGKRIAEFLCHYYGKKNDLPIKIARCFAFVGPYLPLDSHFACGNFIRDCLDKKNIGIKGDGTTVRSYMYASDLVIWLLRAMIQGESLVPYNIGATEEINIAQLAGKIASFFPQETKITIAQTPTAALPERYVPDNTRALTQLNIQKYLTLEDAIRKTVEYYKSID